MYQKFLTDRYDFVYATPDKFGQNEGKESYVRRTGL